MRLNNHGLACAGLAVAFLSACSGGGGRDSVRHPSTARTHGHADANPAAVAVGGGSTLTGRSNNATSCNACGRHGRGRQGHERHRTESRTSRRRPLLDGVHRRRRHFAPRSTPPSPSPPRHRQRGREPDRDRWRRGQAQRRGQHRSGWRSRAVRLDADRRRTASRCRARTPRTRRSPRRPSPPHHAHVLPHGHRRPRRTSAASTCDHG